MDDKSKEIKKFEAYLSKWDKLSASTRRHVFLEAQKSLGEENPLLSITTSEIVRQDYNTYHRESYQKSKAEQKSSSSVSCSTEDSRRENIKMMASFSLKLASSYVEKADKWKKRAKQYHSTIDQQRKIIEKFPSDLENYKVIFHDLMIDNSELEQKSKVDSQQLSENQVEIERLKDELSRERALKEEFERLKDELSRERSLREDFERKYEEVSSKLKHLQSAFMKTIGSPE